MCRNGGNRKSRKILEIGKKMLKQRVLVTGGSGFIGRYVVEDLWSRGHTVIAPTHKDMNCLDREQMFRHVGEYKCDSIVHLACLVPHCNKEDEGERARTNVEMTVNIILACARYRVPLLVYASSTAVYGHQAPVVEVIPPIEMLTLYARSKRIGEELCSLLVNTRHISLRISAPYGEGMRETVISKFVKRAMNGETIEVQGSGNRMQDWTYVRDIAKGIRLSIESETANGVYNLGSGVGRSIKELVGIVVLLTQSKSKIVIGSRPDLQDNYRMKVSYRALEDAVGYVPEYSLEDGLREYIKTIYL